MVHISIRPTPALVVVAFFSTSLHSNLVAGGDNRLITVVAFEPTRVEADRGLSPQDAARAMKIPEGFKVSLIAGEPDVHQPIAMTIDQRGRLWVAEAYGYPVRRPDAQAEDKIVIFEDKDADGRFETRTVFADKLNLVSGLELGFGGVWVGAAPHLLFIPDRDGDDRPDGPPQVLLDGWEYADTHETLNSFIWGPDGWLYGNHGVFNRSVVGKPGTPAADRVTLAPGVWRYHPTKHVFEVFAHGGSNQWGLDFDDHGQAFMTTCRSKNGGGPVTHVIQGGYYWRQSGSHDFKHVYDPMKASAVHDHGAGGAGEPGSDLKYGGHSHVGAMIYLGDSWPERFRNTLFTHNLHGGRINHEINQRLGSGFLTQHAPEDFLFVNDPWFVGVDLMTGPDGSMFMIDWYDRQHCHHREIDKWDRTNGRIYKVSYGQPSTAKIDLGRLSDHELVDLQLHKNDWYVRMARRLLQERAALRTLDPKARATLASQLDNPDPRRRLRALWTLHATGGLSDILFRKALGADDEFVRAWALQLRFETLKQVPTKLAVTLLSMARKDPSPVVRLYLTSASARMPVAARWDLVTALAAHKEDADDRNLPALLWIAAEPLVMHDTARALSLARSSTLPTLARSIYRRAATEPKGLDAVVKELKSATNPGDRQVLLDAMVKALAGRGRVAAPQGWGTAAVALFADTDPAVRQPAESLAAQFGDSRVFPEMRARLGDSRASTAQRQHALDVLLVGEDADAVPIYQNLLDDEAFRPKAIRALGRFDHPATASALLSRYKVMSPPDRADAITTLIGRATSAVAVLAAVEAGTVPRKDVSAFAARQMAKLDSADVTARLNKLWGQSRSPSEEKVSLIAAFKKTYAPPVAWTYSANRGRTVFNRACATCHKLFGEGGDIGPDLTESNRRDLDYLLENVVDPSALIGRDFQLTMLKMKDGRYLSGLMHEQTPAVITLRMLNETQSVPRREVDSIETSDASMMPEGLFEGLSDEEFRSLVRYLMSDRQVPAEETGSAQRRPPMPN